MQSHLTNRNITLAQYVSIQLHQIELWPKQNTLPEKQIKEITILIHSFHYFCHFIKYRYLLYLFII